MIAANEPLVDSEIYRQRFSIEYNNGELTLQATTKAGKRYIACGSDRMVRAIGTELNTLKINNYHLQPTFISSTVVDYDFDSTSREVKYFNETSETNNQKTVNVKTQSQLDTNLLVSCPSLELTKANEVGVNIALVKTNFSTLGTFNTSF